MTEPNPSIAGRRQGTGSLQARITAIAMVPALVLALIVGGLAIALRATDLESGLGQRGLLLARQLASASDYGVFSGNLAALQALAESVGAEAAVIEVRIEDADGATLAEHVSSGLNATALETLVFKAQIRSPQITIDDLDLAAAASGGTASPIRPEAVRGTAVVRMSRAGIDGELRRFAVAVVLILGGGLLVTGWLARRMSRRLSRPVVGMAQAVERIGRGDTHVRVPPSSIGVLDLLGRGINHMAERLERSMHELEQRVREATAELVDKTEEAVRADQAKSRFLAAASHDLRQPMHALGMFVETLAQQPATDAQRELLAQIERAVGAMGDLLDSLLDISRLDAGVIEKRIEALPLQPLFERLESEFAAAAEARGIELVVRGTDFAVESDRILLERILSNLVSNALRYTERGRVLVAARRCGPGRGSVRIDVRDSGPGIADNQREAIFQEFVQLANPERDRSKGLGLGLAIVRRLVSLLGHQLALRSRVGQGSTFTVTVPAARVRPQLPAAALHRSASVDLRTQRAIEAPLAGVTALVIDDDALVRDSLNRLLVTWGASVLTAAGDPGLPARLDPAHAPDLVLCDLRLANGVDGVQLVAAIRGAVGRPVPAVLITGDTDPARVRMANLPGDPVLHKPVRPAQLRALLRTLLRPNEP